MRESQMIEQIEISVPRGWYVLWCSVCLASLAWTTLDAQTYPDWFGALEWAAHQAGHDGSAHEARP